MLVGRGLEGAARLDVRGHGVVSLDLRRDEIERLLRQLLRQAHDAIYVGDDDVAGLDDGVLVLAVEPDGRIYLWRGVFSASHEA